VPLPLFDLRLETNNLAYDVDKGGPLPDHSIGGAIRERAHCRGAQLADGRRNDAEIRVTQ
jgi:hypothetical protein